MAPITAVRSTDLRTRTTAAPVAPQRRQRTAPPASTSAGSNINPMTAILDGLVTSYAHANARKNAATSEEGKAKKELNKAMVANDLTIHETLVTMEDGASMRFTATIAQADEEYVDPAEVLKFLDGDIAAFVKLASVTKTELVKQYGENAAIRCTKSRKKPEALSISKVK